MGTDRTCILVLNYNGRDLLAECLPSILDAAKRAPMPCSVEVIDNASTDKSVSFLHDHWPSVRIEHEPNRGLASFNRVLARRDEDVILLLNNDVKLDPNAIAPLVDAVRRHPDALFAAPRCWTFDGQTYEGMRTRVRMRFGMVQGCCRVPGFDAHIDTPSLTAGAGPILAVDRVKFLALGGYDELYFPGRIEDLDLGFQGWMLGWKGYYVPESTAYHRGFGSFGPAFGSAGCDRLAIRNTLLFCWKNLRGRRLFTHLCWLAVRLIAAIALGRFDFLKAFREALGKLREAMASRRRVQTGHPDWMTWQNAFFKEFQWETPRPRRTVGQDHPRSSPEKAHRFVGLGVLLQGRQT
ncbi:glycosyltransferase [Tautonia rosea]|uniref:glycosyltransferase n=1 Tax=Tautonia rosea TaxID=2728037 RepID=UPI0028F453D7|nr:glycosyltransferase [Tautonia rosea]